MQPCLAQEALLSHTASLAFALPLLGAARRPAVTCMADAGGEGAPAQAGSDV